MLKQIGLEMADPAVTSEYDRPMTNLEALARRLWMHALLGGMGSQRTQEMLVERLEGKAVRGEKPPTTDTTLTEQLDRTEADFINALIPKDDK